MVLGFAAFVVLGFGGARVCGGGGARVRAPPLELWLKGGARVHHLGCPSSPPWVVT